MIRQALSVLGCILWAGVAMADPAERALTAARALEDATAAMQAASGGRDQISALIPTCIDQNSCAHSRVPMEVILSGMLTNLFQALQQWSTMSS